MSKPNKIVGDSLVRDLQKNGEVPENMSVLSGFIGDGETEETIHFYTDVTLKNYLIIPVDSILHQVKLTSKFSPVGGSMIWVQDPHIFDSNDVLKKQAFYEKKETDAQLHNLEDAYNHTDYFTGDLYDQYTAQHQANQNQQQEPSQEGFTHTCVATQPPVCLPEGNQ